MQTKLRPPEGDDLGIVPMVGSWFVAHLAGVWGSGFRV